MYMIEGILIKKTYSSQHPNPVHKEKKEKVFGVFIEQMAV